MSISPRFMGELRDRLTLSDLIGRRVKLVRAGREYKGRCPFHKEKSPSFYVNDDKQFYHCFGCGAHGDAVEFVMQHDGLSFIEAVEALAAQAGMQVPQQSPQDVARAKEEKSLHSLVEETARFFENALYEAGGRGALGYLKERRIPDEILQSFRIGFSPADGQALRKHLKDAGYTDTQMLQAGVLKASSRGTEPYAFFRERIMFPVADRRGRVVAFGGRILPDHLRAPDRGDFKPPKYINSGDTALFHKGRMLYSESRARQAALDGRPVIVVEGYVDVMACVQAGFGGAVAPLGTALTEEQILALWKMIPEGHKAPILCFDGDAAGRRAAARACERILPLLKPDHTALIAFLPEGQDLDSLVRAEGAGALKGVLEAALPLVAFLWSHHAGTRRLETPEDRAGLAHVLEEEAARIPDRTVQQYYRQAFRDRLYQAFSPRRTGAGQGGAGRGGRSGAGRDGKFGGFRGNGAPSPVGLQLPRPAPGDNRRRWPILLAALINHPFLFDGAEEDMGALSMGDERLDALRQAVLGLLADDPALDREVLLNHLIDQGFADELALILSDRIYNHAGFAAPHATPERALEGWQETWRFIHKNRVGRELREAGRALGGEATAENEQRWRALHDIHKASDG